MFRNRRTMAMSLGSVCLVFGLAGCQALRPLSVFHRKCKCEKTTGVVADCTSCASPSEGIPLELTGDFVGELPQPIASGYSDPIMLETSPIMLDGQPLPTGEYLPQQLPGPGAMTPAPSLPADAFQPVPVPGSVVAPPQVLQPTPSHKPIAKPEDHTSLTLPPPSYHVQAPVVHPSPPPRRARVTAPAEPQPQPQPLAPQPLTEPKTVPEEPKTIQPPMPKVEEKPQPKPGGLTMNVTGLPSVANVGDEVRFTISVRNQGESAIEKVELSATLSDNLQGKIIRPDGLGRFEGQKVVFDPIQPLTPMEIEYTITAVVTKADGGNGKLTVEAQSPILMSGPLKNEASVTISNEEAQKDE